MRDMFAGQASGQDNKLILQETREKIATMVRKQVWSELTLSPSAEATDPSDTASFLQWHLQFLGDSFPNLPVTAQGEKAIYLCKC